MVLAHQYLLSCKEKDPIKIQRSIELIEISYKRLTSYECKNGGYVKKNLII